MVSLIRVFSRVISLHFQGSGRAGTHDLTQLESEGQGEAVFMLWRSFIGSRVPKTKSGSYFEKIFQGDSEILGESLPESLHL